MDITIICELLCHFLCFCFPLLSYEISVLLLILIVGEYAQLMCISLVVSVNSLTGRLNQSKEAHHNTTSIQFLHPHTSATVRWSNEYYKRSLTCHILIEYLTIWSSSPTETLPRSMLRASFAAHKKRTCQERTICREASVIL